MSSMRYALRSDDITTLGTWTVGTGTEDSEYPAANIGTDVIAKPAKLTTTTGAWVGDFTARATGKQRVDAACLPMHNLTAALANVTIMGNNTNSWGSPTLSTSFVIPTYRDDGFPIGPWVDLTGVTGYTSAGFAYWRLVVTTANAANVALKLKLLAQLQTLDPNISWGAVDDEERKVIEHETDYGVDSAYDLGITRRYLQGELDSPDAQVTAVRRLWQSCRGKSYPFVLLPDGAVNDAWFVKFVDPNMPRQSNLIDRNTLRVAFKEVSRGLIL